MQHLFLSSPRLPAIAGKTHAWRCRLIVRDREPGQVWLEARGRADANPATVRMKEVSS